LALSWHFERAKSSQFSSLRQLVPALLHVSGMLIKSDRIGHMNELSCLVTVEGLTAYYPISRRQIFRWIAHGCPCRLVGRKRLFKLSAVETWLTRYNSGDWSAWRPPPNGQVEAMVTVRGLLKLLPISRRQLYRWLDADCPSRRIGHMRLFYGSAVELWLAQFNQGDWLAAAA
jgi:hypothetical protein